MTPETTQTPSIADLPRIPLDRDGPVFKEPWEAQAFAMTVKLHESGLFTWPEWTESLSQQIAAAQAAGDPDPDDTYYHHWVKALEGLVLAKTDLTLDQLSRRKTAWERATERVPHGEPILLPEDEEG